jgi:hypothetical protein
VNAAILLSIWILSGTLAVKLFLSWSTIPERAVVHFRWSRQPDRWNLQPDGWSTKRNLALESMFLVFGEAAWSTLILLGTEHGAGLGGLVLLVVNLVTVCVFWQVINYNTRGTPFRSRWVVLPLLALFACVAVVAILQRV